MLFAEALFGLRFYGFRQVFFHHASAIFEALKC